MLGIPLLLHFDKEQTQVHHARFCADATAGFELLEDWGSPPPEGSVAHEPPLQLHPAHAPPSRHPRDDRVILGIHSLSLMLTIGSSQASVLGLASLV
jgi:hypothetical protein